MTLMLRSDLPLPLVRRGKVREVYDAGQGLLLIMASDRVSAFDVVMAEPVPRKGAVLTQLSAFWFERLAGVVESHYVSANTAEILERLPDLAPHREQLAGRAMLVRATEPYPFECVVRGYLAGSAWKEYRAHGTLAREPLAAGLVASARLEPPIFSPATKAESGHDENVTFAAMAEALGEETAAGLRDLSLRVYEAGRAHAESRGIIIADTKFEFGVGALDRVRLIDEVLTPDSSRFWPAELYRPGRPQPSFDKQPLRDHLEGLRGAGQWNGEAPPPPLGAEVIAATSARYLEAFERLTGRPLPEDA
jgi:phosphoribosylaminoimidazole-succinocarboxamide synthase